LLGTIAGRSDSLRYTSTGNGANSYPQTPDGNLIIFDSTYDLNMSWNPHPNQGFHLGKLKTSQEDPSKIDTGVSVAAAGGAKAPSADWVWQASPWGDWNVTDGPDVILGDTRLLITDSAGTGYTAAKVCKGYTVSLKEITPETLDGRFGGNSTGIQYGGNLAVNVGEDVVYGFHGEFWKSGEANQFLHFRDGNFIGQFGLPGLHYTMKCGATQNTQRLGDWSFPGGAGNSMSPAMVANPTNKDELFLYHNDESQHAGVHRWRITGISSVQHLTDESTSSPSQRRDQLAWELDTQIAEAAAALQALTRRRHEL
jgi:hypothetical protein